MVLLLLRAPWSVSNLMCTVSRGLHLVAAGLLCFLCAEELLANVWTNFIWERVSQSRSSPKTRFGLCLHVLCSAAGSEGSYQACFVATKFASTFSGNVLYPPPSVAKGQLSTHVKNAHMQLRAPRSIANPSTCESGLSALDEPKLLRHRTRPSPLVSTRPLSNCSGRRRLGTF
jgi:hypothetical protein